MNTDNILIDQALEVIHSKIDNEVTKQDFQEIYVEDLRVHFENRICYVPLYATFYYNVIVNLANGDTYAGFETNPEDYETGKKIRFFAYNENNRTIIKNALDFLKADHYSVFQDFLGHQGKISIYEELNGYRIQIFANKKLDLFFIEK